MSVALDRDRLSESAIREMRVVLEHHAGPAEVLLELPVDGGTRWMRLGDSHRVAPSPGLTRELERVVGAAVLTS